MADLIETRLKWVRMFDDLRNYTAVCRKCGIARQTLRKWVKRYRAFGLAGLANESRRPHSSPAARISETERQWINDLRAMGMGSRRIQLELKRAHNFDVSRPAIERVLKTIDQSRTTRPIAAIVP